MPLGNYVKLLNETPERMHFSDHGYEKRTVSDGATGRLGVKHVLVMVVDRLNGQPVDTTLSTLAENLAAQLEAYVKDRSYLNYEFTITQHGEGFMRKWTVQATPIPK